MTFRYALTLPAAGANKIARFKAWSKAHTPEMAFSLPPQVPVESTSLTVRLRSVDDRVDLQKRFPETLP
ncbi:hypothetical protein [Pelagibacterium lacus]|uniref:Uncharacterized protein n=1 Tax=Pelagibacterium lacus TaxID=2282655 RepID=A0A369WEI0_9HYPH|nr:hypothetical protein [Pelagibacterium lacus]RDE10561.1 hypothetical protein DVH29_01015 [Pelagibacterium lacus]